MYRLVSYFVATLLACAVLLSTIGIMPYDPLSIVLQTVALLALCWGINRLIAGALKIPINSESSLITGLILSAIAGPLVLPGDWLLAVVLAVGAIGSKYLVVLRRSHLLNPAAAGAVLAAVLLGNPARWWIGSQELLPVVVIGGVLLMTKIRRWHLVFSFMGVYLALLAVDADGCEVASHEA